MEFPCLPRGRERPRITTRLTGGRRRGDPQDV